MRSKVFLQQTLSLIITSFGILLNCDGQGKTLKNDEEKNLIKSIQETEKQQSADSKFYSEREDSTEAERLSWYYKRPRHHLKTVAADGTKPYLDSFIFKASDLMEILDFNASGGALPDKPDKLVIKFGQVLKRSNARWHMIAYGMYDGTLIDNSKAPIFDDAPFDTQPNNRKDSASAKDLQIYYRQPNRRLTTHSKCGVNIPLEGFSFEAWQIREIITKNRSGQNPDTVVFKIGLEPIDVDEREDPRNDIIRWHIIAYGMFNGKLQASSNKKSTMTIQSLRPSIFDKADPCPPCK